MCGEVVTDTHSLLMLRCGLPEPTGDTSRPLSEACSQLSVTGTPLGIIVSGRGGGPELHAF